jgi:hypothetical protein
LEASCSPSRNARRAAPPCLDDRYGQRIHATLAGKSCHATVDGTSATANDGQTQIHFHNSLDKLKIRTQFSNLHRYDVTACPSWMKTGNAVAISVAYRLTPAQTITHP